MIVFPHAKINLGLNILHKREDGYHEIETVLYPVGLADIMEVIPVPGDDSGNLELTVSGAFSELPRENNIIRKAHENLAEIRRLPGLQVHLHKLIPPGSGLGGGSSDAVFFLRTVSAFLDPPLSASELTETAGRLCADCPFFVTLRPALARGKGDEIHGVDLSLRSWYLVILWPGFSISTRKAYASCHPMNPKKGLSELIRPDPASWSKLLNNRFEANLFSQYPELKQFREDLYRSGAVYASLSGSGSALFGLFRTRPLLPPVLEEKILWQEKLSDPTQVPVE